MVVDKGGVSKINIQSFKVTQEFSWGLSQIGEHHIAEITLVGWRNKTTCQHHIPTNSCSHTVADICIGFQQGLYLTLVGDCYLLYVMDHVLETYYLHFIQSVQVRNKVSKTYVIYKWKHLMLKISGEEGIAHYGTFGKTFPC